MGNAASELKLEDALCIVAQYGFLGAIDNPTDQRRAILERARNLVKLNADLALDGKKWR